MAVSLGSVNLKESYAPSNSGKWCYYIIVISRTKLCVCVCGDCWGGEEERRVFKLPRVALHSACAPGSLELMLQSPTEVLFQFVLGCEWCLFSVWACHVISHCEKQYNVHCTHYNSNTWKTEAEGSGVKSGAQGHLELHDTLYPPLPLLHTTCLF